MNNTNWGLIIKILNKLIIKNKNIYNEECISRMRHKSQHCQ